VKSAPEITGAGANVADTRPVRARTNFKASRVPREEQVRLSANSQPRIRARHDQLIDSRPLFRSRTLHKYCLESPSRC